MTLEEFLNYVDKACEEAIDTAADYPNGAVELTRSIDSIKELDRMVLICRNAYQKGYIDDNAAWAFSEIFGILLGEMMINTEGWKWVMNEGTPMVETPEGLKISPLTKINKIITSDEDDEGDPSSLYSGAKALLQYQNMSDEEKERITTYITKHTYVDVIFDDDIDGVWSYSPGDLSLKVKDRVLVDRAGDLVSARVIKIEDRYDSEASCPHDQLKEIIKTLDEDDDEFVGPHKPAISEKEKLFQDEFGFSPFDVLSHRTYNKDEIRKSNRCCCYHCERVFDAEEVTSWLERDADQTAVCPYCGEPFVIGDDSGFPVSDPYFVEALNLYWFQQNR